MTRWVGEKIVKEEKKVETSEKPVQQNFPYSSKTRWAQGIRFVLSVGRQRFDGIDDKWEGVK